MVQQAPLTRTAVAAAAAAAATKDNATVGDHFSTAR